MLKFILPFLLTMSAQAAIAPADKAELGLSKNYVLNSGFERSAAGTAVYKNTAQVLPVNGSGGSPTHLTVSTSTTNPLRDKASLLIVNTSGGTSAQGEGVSLATFNVDSADKGKVLQVSFDYMPRTGSVYSGGSLTTDSDLEVYIYDVANAVVIQPTGYKLDCSVNLLPCQMKGVFQTALNTTSLKVLAHVATTNTNNWNVVIDNLVVGPQVKTLGYAGSDLISAGVNVVTGTGGGTPTKGTVDKDVIRYRRLGDHAHIKGEYRQTAAGSAGTSSGDYLFQLPPGLSFDPAKVTYYTGVPGAAADFNSPIGLGSVSEHQGNIAGAGSVIPYDATHFRLGVVATNNAVYIIGANLGAFSLASVALSYDFEAPIAGWSSNTAVSSDAGDGRRMSATYGLTTTQSVAANAVIKYDTKVEDTMGCYSTGTGLCTVTLPGTYRVSLVGLSATANLSFYVKKNGVGVGYLATVANLVSGSLNVPAVAGDTLGIYTDTAASFNGTGPQGYYNQVTIERVSTGNQQISATETVAAQYYMTANTTGSPTQPFNFDTKDFDSHGTTVTGTAWKYPCPAPGTYSVSFAGTGNTGTGLFYLYKNGVQGRQIGYTGGGVAQIGSSPVLAKCITGDYFDLRANASVTISSGAVLSFLRVGNL